MIESFEKDIGNAIYRISLVTSSQNNKKALKDEEELNFRAEKTREYVHKLAKIPHKTIDELKKKIEEIKIPRLKDQHIAKIVEIMPTTEEEVSAILKAYPITVTKDDMKKIAKEVKDTIDDKYLL